MIIGVVGNGFDNLLLLLVMPLLAISSYNGAC